MTVCCDVGSENPASDGRRSRMARRYPAFQSLCDRRAPIRELFDGCRPGACAREIEHLVFRKHRRGWFECHRTILFSFFCSAGEVPGQFFTMVSIG